MTKYRHRNHITFLLLKRAKTISSKRRLIALANGPLFYIFGYTLEHKPWLTYEEKYVQFFNWFFSINWLASLDCSCRHYFLHLDGLMNIPYNNGKISIGKYYQKPAYIEEDRDMLLIQKHLISDPALLRKEYWATIAYRCSLIFVLVIIILNY